MLAKVPVPGGQNHRKPFDKPLHKKAADNICENLRHPRDNLINRDSKIARPPSGA